MAVGTWTVYVPDRSAPYTFDKSLVATEGEVRQALVQNGITSVSSAVATVEGNTITYRRPSGGTKGVAR